MAVCPVQRFRALVVIVIGIACVPGAAVSDFAPEPWRRLHTDARSPSPADRVVEREPIATPVSHRKSLLLGLGDSRSTTLAVYEIVRRTLTSVVTREGGDLSPISLTKDRIAYLVRPGVNPAKNRIEVVDLRRGRALHMEPASGSAVLGFALSPTGDQLVYAVMTLGRSRSQQVFWRLASADLGAGTVRTWLASDSGLFPREAVPVPIGWSTTTGEVLLQGVLPFRGTATLGIWALSPTALRLRLLLPETSYTSVPRLSPDGIHLAYLATDTEVPARADIPSPGAPPSRRLMVMNLVSGTRDTWAHDPHATLSLLRWSTGRQEVLVSRQEWGGNRLRDIAVLRLGRDAVVPLPTMSPSTRVVDALDCRDGSMFWVEQDANGATVRASDTNLALTLRNHRARLLHCRQG